VFDGKFEVPEKNTVFKPLDLSEVFEPFRISEITSCFEVTKNIECHGLVCLIYATCRRLASAADR
jgi:hypothetical protein